VKWSEEVHTLSYVIIRNSLKITSTNVLYFLTWVLFPKFYWEVSVVYPLHLILRCVCMKEIKCDTATALSSLRGSLISCETIQTTVTPSDRQPDVSYGRFSTPPACIVFSDLLRFQRHLESLLCLYKKRIPLAQLFELFCRQRTLSEESNSYPLIFEHDLMYMNYFNHYLCFDPPPCFVFSVCKK
jgi:hypothetical protein